MEIKEYIRDDGTVPFKLWFDSLGPQAASKVHSATIRLELGDTSAIHWCDGIGEFHVHTETGYRLYLVQEGEDAIVLLGGGDL